MMTRPSAHPRTAARNLTFSMAGACALVTLAATVGAALALLVASVNLDAHATGFQRTAVFDQQHEMPRESRWERPEIAFDHVVTERGR